MADALALYVDRFWISPYAFSAYVALTEKALPFELKTVGLDRREHLTDEYRALSLTARVPALVHGDFAVAESPAIIEYLEEAFPASPRLLPDDVRERARTRQIMSFVRSDLDALRDERATHTMFYERARSPLSRSGEIARRKLLAFADALVPEGRATLFSRFTIADADLAFMLHRLILNGDEVPARLARWASAIWARPSVHAFVTHDRPPFDPY